MYLLILIDVLLYIYMYMHNNIIINAKYGGTSPDFWCWFNTTQFSYHCVHPIHANMFSIQNVITFQLNCAEGLHFSAFHFSIIDRAVAKLTKKKTTKRDLQYIPCLAIYTLIHYPHYILCAANTREVNPTPFPKSGFFLLLPATWTTNTTSRS